jgi:hypothetical protein
VWYDQICGVLSVCGDKWHRGARAIQSGCLVVSLAKGPASVYKPRYLRYNLLVFRWVAGQLNHL